MFGRLLGLTEERVIQDPHWQQWAQDISGTGVANTNAGQNVTQDSAVRLLAVYGAVSFIADTVSTLPLCVYRESNDVKTEIALPRWLVNPNAETDRITFIVQCLWSLLLDGNIYLVPTRNAVGQVQELWVLHPSWVQVYRPRPGAPRVYRVGGIPYEGELIHIPLMMQPGGLRGLSPIECARQSIGLGMGALEHGAQLFGQGSTLSGVINVPGELSDDEAKVMANSWKRSHGGAQKSHLPAVLTGGATWQSVQMTQEQAQFLETRKYTAAEIASQLYHLDPSWLGVGVDGSSLTYKNLESTGIHLVKFTLRPLLERLQQAFTSLLPSPQMAKFDTDDLMQGDLKSRYEAAQLALGGVGSAGVAFATVEEVRDGFDMGPMPSAPEVEPPEVPPTDPIVIAE